MIFQLQIRSRILFSNKQLKLHQQALHINNKRYTMKANPRSDSNTLPLDHEKA